MIVFLVNPMMKIPIIMFRNKTYCSSSFVCLQEDCQPVNGTYYNMTHSGLDNLMQVGS